MLRNLDYFEFLPDDKISEVLNAEYVIVSMAVYFGKVCKYAPVIGVCKDEVEASWRAERLNRDYLNLGVGGGSNVIFETELWHIVDDEPLHDPDGKAPYHVVYRYEDNRPVSPLVYPVIGKCCGLLVREIPRAFFESLHMVGIPLIHERERLAWYLADEGKEKWVAANWGCCELEVTPFLSKIGAAYVNASEKYSYRNEPDFANDFWEVWHIVDHMRHGTMPNRETAVM